MAVEQSSTSVQERQDLSQIIQIDEAKVSSHLNDLVRKTVQETLNEMLDAEAQALCNAERYERSEARKDCRGRIKGVRYLFWLDYPNSLSKKGLEMGWVTEGSH